MLHLCILFNEKEMSNQEIRNKLKEFSTNYKIKELRRLMKRNPEINDFNVRLLNEDYPMKCYRFVKRNGVINLVHDVKRNVDLDNDSIDEKVNDSIDEKVNEPIDEKVDSINEKVELINEKVNEKTNTSKSRYCSNEPIEEKVDSINEKVNENTTTSISRYCSNEPKKEMMVDKIVEKLKEVIEIINQLSQQVNNNTKTINQVVDYINNRN